MLFAFSINRQPPVLSENSKTTLMSVILIIWLVKLILITKYRVIIYHGIQTTLSLFIKPVYTPPCAFWVLDSCFFFYFRLEHKTTGKWRGMQAQLKRIRCAAVHRKWNENDADRITTQRRYFLPFQITWWNNIFIILHHSS